MAALLMEVVMPFHIGFVLFARLTQLDLTGPYEVLGRMPDAEIDLVASTHDPVRSDRGLMIVPTTTFSACAPLDMVCVPGGPGVNDALGDLEILGFLRGAAQQARYVTSVCTGSLLLGAAGLLEGRRAACHWMARDFLRRFGADPAPDRVVVDGKFITGGGVTAGIDFALRIVAELKGQEAAEAIALMIEYDPQPPYDCGSPDRAAPELVERVRQNGAQFQREREFAVIQAAQRLLR
jgi:cyclohexyl-isocyanide hydratase